ncbi:MAG: ribosome biogenesis GTP-binding protein YihA/YsxC [Candidatus Eremiobacterota bacterium]
MRIVSADLLTSSPDLERAPDPGLPEVAMLGRSNVGKSSLINSLLGRKNLARVSQTPGKTRLLNFFLINRSWVLVDMPGYGYAKVSKTEQQRWQREMSRFLREREALRLAIQLIDIRHGPQPSDLEMLAWLDQAGLDRLLVLTKSDKLSRAQQLKSLQQTSELLGLPRESLFCYSSHTHEGRKELLAALANRLG